MFPSIGGVERGKFITGWFNASDPPQTKVTCHPTRAKVKEVGWWADRRAERSEPQAQKRFHKLLDRKANVTYGKILFIHSFSDAHMC